MTLRIIIVAFLALVPFVRAESPPPAALITSLLDGLWYAAKCAGFKPDGREWYHTERLELECLAEIPAGLKPQ